MPYKLDGSREYRSFQTFTPVADDSAAGYIVEGYATTFDSPYDYGGDGMREQVLRSALDGADMSDVIFQLNHEGQTLARLRTGTLEIRLDDHGMWCRADLGGSQAGRDLYEAVKNGLIDQMSWGFSIADGGWEYDPATRTATITKVSKVYDVSAVSIPADRDTELHARSYLDGVIEAEQQELLRREQERRQRAALKLRLL